MKLIRAIVTSAFTSLWLSSWAQTTELVLIKGYDEKLKPLPEASISINGNPFFKLDKKGTSIKEIEISDLPPTTVLIEDESYEVATWNYSKGKLEITIRVRQFRERLITVRDTRGRSIKSATVLYSGPTRQEAVTDDLGQFDLRLPITEMPLSNSFEVPGHKIISVEEKRGSYLLLVESTAGINRPLSNARKIAPPTIHATAIDSAITWSEFLTLFKNLEVSNVDSLARQKLDEKINALVLQSNSAVYSADHFEQISDSTSIYHDVETLIKKATAEKQFLESQFTEVDQGIKILREKLSQQRGMLGSEDKATLLSNIARLENLLAENANAFQSNTAYYQQLLDLLKEKYVQVGYLEDRLTKSEQERSEERRAFATRLLIILCVVGVFAIMVALLIFLYLKVKKANAQIVHVNENLEHLVTQRTKMLTEANRELDTFLYRASHDLRSPIRSIIGLCNIAQHVSGTESLDLLSKVNETVWIMDNLLKKLSIISEINQPSGYDVVDVHLTISNILKEADSLIKSNNVKVEFSCPRELLIHSYPHLVHAAVFHVVENALYYSVVSGVESPQIEVNVDTADDNVVITVCDNGLGFDDSIKPRVFDMFFKGNEKSKGNGLGLYIVMKSIQALGGAISVDSAPGTLTRIRINIPKGAKRSDEQIAETTVAAFSGWSRLPSLTGKREIGISTD